ncbi:MAG: penicillin-binding transpeptidase domain-containing protein [Bacteroidales bacterium]
MVTLEWGLANSVNYISAWLVKRFNPQSVVDVIKKMGVTSHIDAVPSVIFGTSDISLEEMVGAFNVFSNKGVYIEPVYVTRIEDKHGNEISSFYPQQVEAISEKTAYLMVQLLKNVVDKGTAGRLRWFFNFEAELGGKTGTTQNQSDGWYMGLSPQLTAGVWVGAEDRSVHFNTLSKGSGSYMALPIYGYFMEQVYADSTLGITQEDTWEEPVNFNMILDCPDVEQEAGYDTQQLYVEPDEF